MTTPKLQQWKAAIGPYGLNLLTLDEIAEQALATDDAQHMRLAVFFIATYKYDDAWRNKTCTPETGMKHYHRLIDAISVHSPLLAIATCYQAHVLKEANNHDDTFLHFETAVVAHAHRHFQKLKGRDIEKALLFLVSDIDECEPSSQSPQMMEMMKGLMEKLANENPLRARKAALHLLQVLDEVSEPEKYQAIFHPYTVMNAVMLRTRPPTRRRLSKNTTTPS